MQGGCFYCVGVKLSVDSDRMRGIRIVTLYLLNRTNSALSTRRCCLPMRIKKRTLLIAAVLLVSTIGLAYALSNMLTQSYLYRTPPGQMIVTGPSTMDFGTLSFTPNTTIIFNDALTVSGSSFRPLTIQFVRPDLTWDKVFVSVQLLVLAAPLNCPPGADCPVVATLACVSLGSGSCYTGTSSEFTPTARSYAYEVTYTVVPGDIPSNLPLQTTWSA